MIPDYLIEAYQELQQEKGRERITFEEAQEELSLLSEVYLVCLEDREAFAEHMANVDDLDV